MTTSESELDTSYSLSGDGPFEILRVLCRVRRRTPSDTGRPWFGTDDDEQLASFLGCEASQIIKPDLALLQWAGEALARRNDVDDITAVVGDVIERGTRAVWNALDRRGMLSHADQCFRMVAPDVFEPIACSEDQDDRNLHGFPRLLEPVTREPVIEAGGVYALDAVLAEALELLGERKMAETTRQRSSARMLSKWRRDEQGRVPVAALLFEAAWLRCKAERKSQAELVKRRHEMPVANLTNAVAVAIVGIGRHRPAWDELKHAVAPEPALTTLRGSGAPALYVPREGEGFLDRSTDGDTVGLVAVWLCRESHRLWLQAEPRPDVVKLTASKAELARMGLGGEQAPIPVIEHALNALKSIAFDPENQGTGALVLDYYREDASRSLRSSGGRPSEVFVVTLGWPLIPKQFAQVAKRRDLPLPAGSTMYAPVFDPLHTPLVGNQRTYRTQRLAFAVVPGQWLLERREEYVDCGGVKLDSLRQFLTRVGLYHRSHQSLADDVARAWTQPMQGDLISGKTMPLLIPTRLPGVWRLSPDYRDEEELIAKAAGFTKQRRAAQNEATRQRNDGSDADRPTKRRSAKRRK